MPFIFYSPQIYGNLSSSQSSGLSSQCDVQVIITEKKESDIDLNQYQKQAYVAIGLIMSMSAMSVFFPMIVASFSVVDVHQTCSNPCRCVSVYYYIERHPWTWSMPSQ